MHPATMKGALAAAVVALLAAAGPAFFFPVADAQESLSELLPFAVGAAPEGCDVGKGEWVRDEAARPWYAEEECPYIQPQLTCQAHGRPDAAYQHWRWQPRGCDLPSFNATAVLEMLRGKRMLFVGDSLLREQYVSLLCLLHRAIPDASKSFEAVDSLSIFRAKDHDATIEFYWAPMLAESSSDDGADHHLADRVIRGAPMNKHSRFWKGADVLVFNSYLWWMTGDKIQILRGADEDMSKDIVEMEAEEAYRLVLHQVVRWVEHNVDPKNARVFFVTASPTHASGGEDGGNCYGQTSPVAAADAESYHGSTSGRMLQVAGEVLAASRVPVGVVNITRMSELRRDAHTQTYKEQWAQPAAEQAADPRSYADCTHWCLPGVPDAWNELLYWKLFFPARDQAI
ncbi:protein trichome birefringence-like 33 [Oryza brachyantha]|uniref:protein trichome birefringence-like 33 n=1 Tax=Oryza brachyantha TaxID=4533 RepID=UPI001ADC3FBF|nr:protein trichome birefringence-like 33 [Oryza brachyantha]